MGKKKFKSNAREKNNMDYVMENQKKQPYQILFQELPDAIFIIEKDKIVNCNEAAIRMFGYESKGNLLGLEPFELSPLRQPSGRYSFEQDKEYIEIVRKNRNIRFEWMHRKKDGESFYTEVILVVLPIKEENLVCAVIKDITEWKKMKQMLEASENKYRSMFENSHAIMLLIDPATAAIMDANPAACCYYGYEKEEIKKLSITDINILTKEEVNQEMQRAKMEKRKHFCFRHQLANKEIRDVEVFSGPIEINGKILLYSIVHDITEKQAVTEALKENEKKFEKLFNHAQDEIFLSEIDEEGNPIGFIEVNETACRRLGYTKNELMRMNFKDILLAEDLKRYASAMEKISKTGHAKFEVIQVCKNKNKIPVEVNAHVFELFNKTVMLSIARDISERKIFEEKLKLQKSYFQQLFENSPEAIALLDNHSKIVNINKGFEVLFGYALKEVLGRRITEVVCPKDFYEESRLMTDTIEKGGFIRRDVVRITKTGRLIHAALLGYPIFNNHEQIGIYVIYSDITERKMREDKLKLFAEVYNNNTEGVVITDRNGKIEWINRAFTQITGYTEDEVIGQNPRILKSGKHEEAFYENMWKLIIHKGNWQGEIWNKRKDEQIYLQWLNIFSIRDEQENITHFTAILSDITVHKEKEDQIKHLAYYDSLTNLHNRPYFLNILEYEISKENRAHNPLAVVFFDLDGFKKINDNLGHSIGDKVLQAFAAMLKENIQKCDIAARIGGDEFVVLLPHVKNINNALHTGNQVLEKCKEELYIDGYEINLSVSVGIALYPDDGIDANTLLKNADMAMYRAKKLRNNQIEIYSPILDEQAKEAFMLENHLRHALHKNELFLYYQPIVDVNNRKVVGAEALLRWDHPKLGFVSPMKFIPIAENNGMIIPIGEWVMREACTQNKAWQEKGYNPIFIAVNISMKQLYQKNFAEQVIKILKETGLDARYLELEITETVYMANVEEIIHNLKILMDTGVKLAIDDFGTGYSSLGKLKKLDINKLKIDKSFIKDIYEDRNAAKIISAIISMARNLGLEIIAEGVETNQQLRFLKKHKCKMVQGYLFSKPMDVENFEDYLKYDAGNETISLKT
ncbi:PAS domain S-box protein [Clostridiaceae bacterium 35-E11]